MNVIHEQVCHRQFGVGTVIGQTMTTLTVKFCETYGLKKFLYPAAFESFLKMCDPVAKARMDEELRLNREKAEAGRQKRLEEEEKRREEERRVLLEQKRTAAKKRSSAGRTSKKTKKQPADTELYGNNSDA